MGEETAFTNVIAAVSCEDETAVSERGGTRADLPLKGLRRTILVVEDNPINREMLVQMLSEDYDVLCAGDGEEGIAVLAENYRRLSLIILDVYMPKCDARADIFGQCGPVA